MNWRHTDFQSVALPTELPRRQPHMLPHPFSGPHCVNRAPHRNVTSAPCLGIPPPPYNAPCSQASTQSCRPPSRHPYSPPPPLSPGHRSKTFSGTIKQARIQPETISLPLICVIIKDSLIRPSSNPCTEERVRWASSPLCYNSHAAIHVKYRRFAAFLKPRRSACPGLF